MLLKNIDKDPIHKEGNQSLTSYLEDMGIDIGRDGKEVVQDKTKMQVTR